MKRRAYGGETGEGKSGEIVSALSANDVGKKGAGGGGRWGGGGERKPGKRAGAREVPCNPQEAF